MIGIELADNSIVLLINQKDYEHIFSFECRVFSFELGENSATEFF